MQQSLLVRSSARIVLSFFFFWGGVKNDSRERASSCTFFNSIPLILQEHSEWHSQRSFECEAEGQSEFDKLNRQILCG